MATSYANVGGTGNRTAIITVTINSFTGTPSILVNGNTTETVAWFNSGSTNRITFQFLTPKVIDEAKYYQNTTTNHGTWKWQGSNNGSTWTDIGISFIFGGSTIQTITVLAGNVTAYTYYQLVIVSGASSSGPYVQEMEFKIDDPVASSAESVQFYLLVG